MLGVTFNANEGRITIFRSMLEALGWPTYYRFLYNRKMGQIAVQACKAENAGAHRVTRLNETNSCEIKCVAFSRMIYQDAHWNMKRSYRLDGKLFPEQNLVSFPILDAIPIENGKILEAAVSPTVIIFIAATHNNALQIIIEHNMHINYMSRLNDLLKKYLAFTLAVNSPKRTWMP